MAKQKTNWDNVSQSEWYNSILENKVLLTVVTIATVVMLILAALYGMVGGNNDAPDFTLKDTEGVIFSLSDYEGEKVVILFFMFSTCEPCEKFVEDVLGPYSGKIDKDDVAILSVSVFGNDDERELKNYAEQHDWRHALGDKDGEIEIAYEVIGTPKIFIIDKKGEIAYSYIGGLSEEKLSNIVENAMEGR